MNNIEMLRWVLAGIGIFLVVLLYWFGRADKRNYRKREQNMRPKPVEPYMSNDALNLDLNASQKEEISREIQASPITEGVFDKVDELYEEVTDREAVHDEVVAVPDLPSFSAHSDPVEASPASSETDSAIANKESDADANNAINSGVPAWLQQTDNSAQAEPNTESPSAATRQRNTGTVGLFAGDERNPEIAPALPEQNKQTEEPPPASESSGMPENYSDKIKQAVAAIQNIERSKEESVPENRNLFDRLPPSDAGKKRTDSGIQDENIYANSKNEAEALNEALAAVEENAGEVQSSRSQGEIEAEVEKEPAVASESVEQKEVDVQPESDEQTTGQDENNSDVNIDKSAKEEADSNQEETEASGQNIDSNANDQVVEQTNALLQGNEVTESAKTTAAVGQTVFYPSSDNEREQGASSAGSSDESQQLKAEQDVPVQKEDNTVVRIDPSRFRKSEAQLVAQNKTEIDDDSQAKDKKSEEVKGNSASIQLVDSKTTEEVSHQEVQVNTDSAVSDEEQSAPIESEEQTSDEQLVLKDDESETTTEGQTKTRVNGFDRDNPEADLVSFYLVNSEKPYKAHDVMRLALEHGLEFDKNNTMYMAQDSGFAKDYVFSLASIDENCQLHKNEDSDAATKTIVFRLLQGKEIMGRLNTLDSMLRLAKHIEGELGGALFDVGYCPITDLMISHLRRQIQENDVKNCQ